MNDAIDSSRVQYEGETNQNVGRNFGFYVVQYKLQANKLTQVSEPKMEAKAHPILLIIINETEYSRKEYS